jgi:hypothetical protein
VDGIVILVLAVVGIGALVFAAIAGRRPYVPPNFDRFVEILKEARAYRVYVEPLMNTSYETVKEATGNRSVFYVAYGARFTAATFRGGLNFVEYYVKKAHIKDATAGLRAYQRIYDRANLLKHFAEVVFIDPKTGQEETLEHLRRVAYDEPLEGTSGAN